jgi:hypothetical protein
MTNFMINFMINKFYNYWNINAHIQINHPNEDINEIFIFLSLFIILQNNKYNFMLSIIYVNDK